MFKNFFNHLLSIDESRKSCVVIILLLVSGFSVFKLYTIGDIPSNAMTVILTLSTLIFGVNAISSLPAIISSSRTINNPNNTYSNCGTYGTNQYAVTPQTTNIQPIIDINTNKEPTNITNSPV